MLDFEAVLDMLSGLTLLKYFPSDVGARLELAKLIGRMASHEDQVEWLVNRTLALCNEWPGPLVLRQIFCSKFRPRDGVDVGGSEEYPEGIPSEQKQLIALPPARDPAFDRAATELEAELIIAITPPGRAPYTDDELAAFRQRRREYLQQQHAERMSAVPNPVTDADIQRAVDELRAKKEKGEA